MNLVVELRWWHEPARRRVSPRPAVLTGDARPGHGRGLARGRRRPERGEACRCGSGRHVSDGLGLRRSAGS